MSARRALPRPHRRRVAAAALALALAAAAGAPGLARAQTCPAGMAASEGHCCWPGQAWSASAGACTGMPTCPTGTRLDAAGTSCEVVPAEVQAIGAIRAVEIDELWPAAGEAGPPGGRNPRHERQPDGTLRDAGIALLLSGWLASIASAAIIASFDEQFHTGPTSERAIDLAYPVDCADLHAGLAFIPIVGDLLGAALATSCTTYRYDHNVLTGTSTRGSAWPLAAAIPATALQLVGLGLLLGGLGASIEVLTIDEPHAALRLDLSIEPAIGGGSLALRF